MNFNQVKFSASYGLLSQIPPSEKLEIVFAGRSNVGKSSLLNKLFGRKDLARVSSVPGKTATINFYEVETVYFVDLPGYGYAKTSKSEKQRWSELIEGYFHNERDIGLVVQLIDFRHAPSKLDLQMIEFLVESEFPFMIALTKMDKLKKSQQQKRLEELHSEIPYSDQITIVSCSTKTGEGIAELKEILQDICENDKELES